MKSFIILLFLCVLGVQIGISQNSLNDYHYVVVPDQFEFLKGKDQFQVNSLTTWLLNKNGFNAYLDSQLPLSLRKLPCKGLKAVVATKENFIVLKANIVLTDCMGNVVYTSDEGRSKDKDYRKSYHEAIRQAFESITALNVHQLPIDSIEDTTDQVVQAVKDDSGGISSGGQPTLAAADAVVKESVGEMTPNDTNDTETVRATAVLSSTENASDSNTNANLYFKDYTLVPNKNGFDIQYKGTAIGTAKPSADEAAYLVNTSQFNGLGYATENGFVIERAIEGMDQIIKMTFTRK